eukprot:7379941-Prymnesium_polylepis.2
MSVMPVGENTPGSTLRRAHPSFFCSQTPHATEQPLSMKRRLASHSPAAAQLAHWSCVSLHSSVTWLMSFAWWHVPHVRAHSVSMNGASPHALRFHRARVAQSSRASAHERGIIIGPFASVSACAWASSDANAGVAQSTVFV